MVFINIPDARQLMVGSGCAEDQLVWKQDAAFQLSPDAG
jgi:hypothetical protein